jgi:hypothetical protein
MKKISTVCMGLVLMFALFNSSSAQDSTKTRYVLAKGSKLISGNASFRAHGNNYLANSISSPDGLGFSIREMSGFFVANNLVVGSSVGYSLDYSKYYEQIFPEEPYEVKSFTHNITPGVFLRYYKMFTPKFGFFGQFNGDFLIYRRVLRDSPMSVGVQKGMGVQVSIAPNLVYFFTRRLAMEAGFGNIQFRYMSGTNGSSYAGGFQLNPSLLFGLTFYMGKAVQPFRKN